MSWTRYCFNDKLMKKLNSKLNRNYTVCTITLESVEFLMAQFSWKLLVHVIHEFTFSKDDE